MTPDPIDHHLDKVLSAPTRGAQRTAMSEAMAAGGWQPIETAPKEGHIIGYWEGYKRPCVMWWNVADQAFESWADRHEEPTHWRPLQPPPAEGE